MLKGFLAGAAGLCLALAASAGEAAPIRAGAAFERAAGPILTVQFYDWDDEDGFYDPPPVYRAPPSYVPRPVYRVPRQDPYGYHPIYRTPPAYGYYRPYDKESAKAYVKSYRRAQKETFKERVRAWNRANGY